ncbi:hypothetical protein ACYOEI_21760 [Singulisphaera rosea]
MDDANNPYNPPIIDNLKPLGSLAQSARGKELRQAQGFLFFIGVLTLAVNGFFLFNLPNEIQQAIQQNDVGPAEQEQFRQQVRMYGLLLYGLPALLGILYIVFGIIIKRYPVFITTTSLVLYITSTVGFAILNPASAVSGIVIKAVIILALFRAIKAAKAYESHTVDTPINEDIL